MTNQELYTKAKEAYYNGEPIMSDLEFDELERSLGLENKGYIGTHRNPSYTVKHPVLMGSLAKIQVHAKNGSVNWDELAAEVDKYMSHYNNSVKQIVITPKFDGCSFEAVIDNSGKNHKIVSISSRGDGEYGKDMMNHIKHLIEDNMCIRYNDCGISKPITGKYILRGEVLVNKQVYAEKYADKYINPRSFVAGVLGRDYNKNDKELIEQINDLSIVIYDSKIYEGNTIKELDWMDMPGLENVPVFANMTTWTGKTSATEFKKWYTEFDSYREQCEFALDGFVIKPERSYRNSDYADRRPKDCVAIKFIPMEQSTTVTDIEWNLGKTGELTPVIIFEPVEMDGKLITRCSGHNYGYLIDNKVSKGTKIVISLAGDIIPFLYKITDTSEFDENNIGNFGYETTVQDCHLMALLDETEIARNKFVTSAVSLGIPNIGEATANAIFNFIKNKNDETGIFFDEAKTELTDNILLVSAEDVYFGAGAGKAGQNAKKSFEKTLKEIDLVQIIKSCSFRLCGEKAAKQIVNNWFGKSYDFAHIPEVAYSWINDTESYNMKQIVKILNHMGKSVMDFNVQATEDTVSDEDKIPVILTGEPNNYGTKGQFMSAHPEYRLTTSWKEVKIVFTNDLSSNTGKMKKAREKNIEIRVY